MTDLLLQEQWNPQLSRADARPIMGEFQIGEELFPVLVSGSSKSVVWVSKPKRGAVRAAIREGSVYQFYWDVVCAVQKQGRVSHWENTFSLNKAGIEASIAHLREYGIDSVVCLCQEGRMKYMQRYFKDVPSLVASWLPVDVVVVVPEDRSYLGWVSSIEGYEGHYVSVVHNPSRAMAISMADHEK